MDGTLINSEDIYTECTSELLQEFGKGPLTWDVKMQLQGRPGPDAAQTIVETYDLPLQAEEFMALAMQKQESKWSQTKFLPGALELLKYLRNRSIPIALGTSTNTLNYQRKTAHLLDGFDLFGQHVVRGDDPRIPKGRGKPNPDIWYHCLASLNEERLKKGEDQISIEECLIFEDGIAGVQSAAAAKATVIWIPDHNLIKLLNGKEKDIIGNSGEIINNFYDFDKAKYAL